MLYDIGAVVVGAYAHKHRHHYKVRLFVIYHCVRAL